MLENFKITDPRIYSQRVKFIYAILNWFVFLWYLFSRLFVRIKQPKNSDYKKILLVKRDTIGDLILTIPTIRAIRKKFSKSKITLLIAKSNQGLFDNCPYIDEIVYFDAYWFLPDLLKNLFGYMAKKYDKTGGQSDFLKKLKREEFDLGIDLRGNLFTILLLYFLKIKERVSFSICGGGYLLTQIVPFVVNEHEVEHNLEIAKYWGAEIEEEKHLEYWINKESTEKVAEFLRKNEIKEKDLLIGLNPSGRWKYRLWPSRKLGELGNLLKEKYQAKIVIIKAPGEITADEVYNKMHKNAIIFEGSLQEMAAIIKRCNLFISNDTGPMHLAAAFNTPLVALFGPGNINFLYPYSKNSVYIRRDFPCSPCEQRQCLYPKNNCMMQITVEEVFKACKKFL